MFAYGRHRELLDDALVDRARATSRSPRRAREARLELGGARRDRRAARRGGPRARLAQRHLLPPLERRVAVARGIRADRAGRRSRRGWSTIARPSRSRIAPRGAGDRDLAHAVVERLAPVLVAGQHLQVPEAQEDDREQREGEAAEDRDAQRELRRQRRAAALEAAGDASWLTPRERREAAGRVGAAPAAARVLGQRGQQPAAHDRVDGQRDQRRRACTGSTIWRSSAGSSGTARAEQELHQREAELRDRRRGGADEDRDDRALRVAQLAQAARRRSRSSGRAARTSRPSARARGRGTGRRRSRRPRPGASRTAAPRTRRRAASGRRSCRRRAAARSPRPGGSRSRGRAARAAATRRRAS